ncbi:MAG: RHS repeat-associated core domain-containing protein [Planctomycetaceae bacterium]|jgi:RHS repeat-associated protein|nr:RHS repeat-associated core domain-containing protein [Planctomycetaceae bacterium]
MKTRVERISYDYNADGIWVSPLHEIDSDADGDFETRKTKYLNDPLNLTGYSQVLKQTETDLETDEQANITYIIGRNKIALITVKNGTEQEYYFTFDGHGSTRVLTDLAGAIVELYAFDAYGNVIGFDPSTALTEFLYSGEQFDSKIGQQYLRARYYDPATGRFNRLDPFFGNLNDPPSLHKYLYAHGNPVNGIDPSGRSLAGVSLSIAIGAGLGALVGGAFSYYDVLLGGGTHSDALGAYWEGFKMGVVFGAILGPFHYLAIEARGIIQILGIVGALTGDIFLGGLGLVATVESFVNGQWQQGLFRGTTTIAGTWLGIRGIAKAKLNTRSKPNTHESIQELHGAVRNLADETDSLYGELNVYN